MIDDVANDLDTHRRRSRLRLVWDVLVFQFKLAADGLRDVLLSPLSVGSALLGLIIGGDDPYRYFRRVIRFGRRTELWINLFDRPHRNQTSDALIDPIKDELLAKAESHPWINKAGERVNKALDGVHDTLRTKSDAHNRQRDTTDKTGDDTAR